MKNLIFSFLVLILSAGNVAFGQVSNTEIANAILKAKEVNRQFSGIENPNDIYPGQTVWIPVEVKKGDTQWFIFRDMFYPAVKEKPTVLQEMEPNQGILPQPEPEVQPEEKELMSFSDVGKLFAWLFLAVVVACILFLFVYVIYKVFKNQTKERSEEIKFSLDPTKEGPAFVEGGVHTEEEASRQFVNLARMSNPNLNPSNIVVKERKRVYVSTPNGESAIVNFANGTTQELAFRNVLGWQAMVSVDGGKSFQREVVFEDCGNPVYSRTSMKDLGLIITDEPINFGDEVIASETVISDESIDKKVDKLITELEKEDKIQVVEKREMESDEVMIVNDHSLVAEKFLKTQQAHRVTMDYQKNADGGVTIKSVFETKNNPVVPKEEAKKEN